jgi:GT2 family glycosyltransferase/glycosyltransferase involved in cell wall biosynthesis
MWRNPEYWLDGEKVQNFGDFLSEFFMQKLFYSAGLQAGSVRIVGSCMDDGLLGDCDSESNSRQKPRTIYWGCGLRHKESLSERNREFVDILAVRGPLSRSALRLGKEIPMGDPGLLLPALYTPNSLSGVQGERILVPHFQDERTDDELLGLSGCSAVLRPNISNDIFSIYEFIDRLAAAEFVLCGSLHAAIAAAAYGRSFGFWDSGSIDLPFKWEDFSASISIPCVFHRNVDQAQTYFDREIKPKLSIPILWPMLLVAPFPVRPDVMLKVMEFDVGRHGVSALQVAASPRISHKVQSSILEANSLVTSSLIELKKAQDDLYELSQAHDKRLIELRNNLRELARVRAEADEIDRIRAEIAEAKYERDLVLGSTSWRVMAPFREIGMRYPMMGRALRRSLKVLWWTLTLQLGYRYSLWRRSRPIAPITSAHADTCQVQEVVAPDLGFNLESAFVCMHGKAPIYFPPVENPVVSIVIPVYRGMAVLENCLRSLSVCLETEPSFEVILVDDCPEEQVLWGIPNSGGLFKISNTENLGFLLTCNKGAEVARGRFICLLNSDTLVYPGWLRHLVDAEEETPDAGLVGGMLLNADGTIQDAGWRILQSGWGYPIGRDKDARDGAFTYRREVDCVTGACFLMKTSLFLDMGGLDAHYAPAFYEEFDLAFRARQRGLKVIYEPKSRVVHLGSASYGEERRNQLSAINHAKFSERFATVLRMQPSGLEEEFLLQQASDALPVLLVVDYGVPQPNRHAGDVTMSSYLSLLATTGWRVVFCPMDGRAEGPSAENLECQGIMLIRSPQTLDSWLVENGKHVKEVWLARPEIAEKIISPLRDLTSARLTYYTHDLHHVRLEREAELYADDNKLAEAKRMKKIELSVFASVDQITSPSADEAEIIRNFCPGKSVSVLPPYYYEANEICPQDASHFEDLTDVVFVGGFPHTPNVDAALYIANEIMPQVWERRPDVRLVLVGYAPPAEILALAGSRVVVTGQVPDVKPYLNRARVLLVALRYGAGVKGKTVDALRQGVPVVSTQVGVEGIGVTPGLEAIVSESAEGLAAGVLELLSDTARCAALSAAGADLISKGFSRNAACLAIDKVFGA